MWRGASIRLKEIIKHGKMAVDVERTSNKPIRKTVVKTWSVNAPSLLINAIFSSLRADAYFKCAVFKAFWFCFFIASPIKPRDVTASIKKLYPPSFVQRLGR
jgi:hypothetical protein